MDKILQAAAAKAKRPAGLLIVLALLREEQHQYDKAADDYREVLAKDPHNYQALNNLALDLARTGGDLDQALSLVNQALAVTGPLAAVLDSRAIVYIARQEPEKALIDLDAAIKDDGTAEQYFHQAWAYSLADNKAAAAAAFATAIKKGINPSFLDPHEVAAYDRLKDIQ